MDTSDLIWTLVGALGLLLIGFGFASAQSAFSFIEREKVKDWIEKGERRGAAVERLIENRSRLLEFLALLDFGILISFVALVTARFFVPAFSSAAKIFLVSILALLYLLLAELLPKKLAENHKESFCLAYAPPLLPLYRLLGWVADFLDLFSEWISSRFDKKGNVGEEPREEEIRMLVSKGEEEIHLEKEEKELIKSIFVFGETMVKEVMVPRIDMVCIEASSPVTAVLDLVISHGYSRLPVYEGTIDNVVGIVNAKDLLSLVRDNKMGAPLREILRPVHYVPESKKVDELLREMQREKISMAIVVDEYGGTDGLVTMEDLIEEIVGEIADEHDKAAPTIEPLQGNSWLVDAGMNIEDLNAQLGLSLPFEEFETLGGYLYGLLGRVPHEGEQVETPPLTLVVAKTKRQRITRVKITRNPPVNGEKGGGGESGNV